MSHVIGDTPLTHKDSGRATPHEGARECPHGGGLRWPAMNSRGAIIFAAVLTMTTAFPQQVAASPAQVTSVGNPDCPHGGNYSSTACLLYIGTAALVESNFNRWTMTMPAALVAEGNHILHALWAYSGDPCKSFVEQAYVYGFRFHNYYDFALVRFHYLTPPPGEPKYQDYADGITSNDLGRTKFQTKWIGGQTWQVWRNDSLRLQFTGGSLGAGACIGQAGLEVSKRFNLTGIESTYVSYTHNNDVYWYDANMNFKGGWADGSMPEYSWIDYPCNLGQVPPNCLNGVYNTGSQWADNKP